MCPDAPLSVMDATLRDIFPQDLQYRQQAEKRLNGLAMPHWALGDLMDLAVDLAGMTRSLAPPIVRKKIVVMVGDHGVTAEGVSPYPAEVTTQMVQAFVRGQAGINALSRSAGAEVVVVDVGARDDFTDWGQTGQVRVRKIGRGTANMVYGPAMTRTHAIMAVQAGIEVAHELAPEVDVFGTGEMGIGNTTPSTAITAVFTGKPVAELTGSGTGLDQEGVRRKADLIEKALHRNRPDPKDPIDVLAKVGGFEIGALAGLILGAAVHQKPVVVDGFISGAAALLACRIEPFVRDYLIFAHQSAEPGHAAILSFLQRTPLFDLHLRLGEGTGAALGMQFLDAAARILTDIATFAEAGVSTAH